MPCLSDSLLLSMLIRPPCPSTNCFATNSPIPVPTVVRVVKKASKTFGKILRCNSHSIVFNRQDNAIPRTWGIANGNGESSTGGHGVD